MTYIKPQVEIVKFDSIGFMTSSVGYGSAAQELGLACSVFSGTTSNFTCDPFGGYPAEPRPKKATVTIAGGTYTFVYHGNHWACTVVS